MISNFSKVISLLAIVLVMISCNSGESKKKEIEKADSKNTSELSNNSGSTSLEWRAFKTSEKIAVKGTFNDIVVESGKGETVEDVITSTSFKISTKSVFTANEGRDLLLRKFFFGAMINAESISGNFISAKDGKGIVAIKMNDVEYNNDFSYTLVNDSLKISTVILLDNWNGASAIESLHEKCADKHTGSDGISKTWSDVEVDITTLIK
ncbi:MAG: hypothetical protein KAH10_04375 [Flavobacteriales bacterium]|nr:hypothetical protein [Flavobacteriales bacterium]